MGPAAATRRATGCSLCFARVVAKQVMLVGLSRPRLMASSRRPPARCRACARSRTFSTLPARRRRREAPRERVGAGLQARPVSISFAERLARDLFDDLARLLVLA